MIGRLAGGRYELIHDLRSYYAVGAINPVLSAAFDGAIVSFGGTQTVLV